MSSVCIFCSASSNVDAIYKTLARDVGAFCAGQGWDIVYGGAEGGLMGTMATAALEKGARVTGVLPRSLEEQERAHRGLSELIVVETLHERQQVMAERSDGFIILPGGLGTLAEFFEVVTWKQIGLHEKPIVLIDINGYWDGLLKVLDDMEQQNFLHSAKNDLFTVSKDVDMLPKILRFS